MKIRTSTAGKRPNSRLLKNSLLGAAGMRRIIFQTRKCLKDGARHGQVPGRSELKKARDGFFQHPNGQRGYTYVLALAAVVIVSIFAEAASLLTSRTVQAGKETELIFRGLAYRNAIKSYHQSGGNFPRNLEDLLKDPRSPNRRHIRALYLDPMAKEGQEWLLIRAADGSIAGVASKSKQEPLKKTNFPKGLEKFENVVSYSEWIFEYIPPPVPTATPTVPNPVVQPPVLKTF